MSINPRRQRHFKKKVAGFFLFVSILGAIALLVNIFFVSGKPLYISPLGKNDNEKILIEKLLRENKILFSKVSLSDYFYNVEIENNGQVKLSPGKDLVKQVASLQRIVRQLTIEGKAFKSIDFRFDEPVVSF